MAFCALPKGEVHLATPHEKDQTQVLLAGVSPHHTIFKTPTTRNCLFLIFCHELKSCPIPHAEPIGYMNASYSLVLCLNTTQEQPTCNCSTASPIQHQWEGKVRPGTGKTMAFPPAYMSALVDLYLHREHSLFKDRKRSEGRQSASLHLLPGFPLPLLFAS